MNDKYEIIHVGNAYYVIPNRLIGMPDINVPTDEKYIAQMKKQGKSPYVTNQNLSGSPWADGPYASFEDAKNEIDKLI